MLKRNFFTRLQEILTPSGLIRVSESRFVEQKKSLMLRVNSVVGGLSAMSLNAVPLDTQSLIELYYTVYNPELFETQRMQDVSTLQVER